MTGIEMKIVEVAVVVLAAAAVVVVVVVVVAAAVVVVVIVVVVVVVVIVMLTIVAVLVGMVTNPSASLPPFPLSFPSLRANTGFVESTPHHLVMLSTTISSVFLM